MWLGRNCSLNGSEDSVALDQTSEASSNPSLPPSLSLQLVTHATANITSSREKRGRQTKLEEPD